MANSPNVIPIGAATGAGKSRSVGQKTTASAAKNISTQTAGSGGGQSDWAQSVETRLGELRSDVRNLLIAGGIVALALAGAGWATYNSAMDELRGMAVTQQEISGKIEVLDARVAGRMDLMEERLGAKPETSPGAGQTRPVR